MFAHSSDEPTAEPTAEPTLGTTFAPTARPSSANTRYPTAAAPVQVSFTAEQTLSGVSITEWDADETNNENTVKTTIAACMDGITTSDIQDFLASAPDSSKSGFTFHLRALAAGDSILLTYRVVTNSKLTASQLFDQLSNKVNNGDFTIILQQFATGNTATYLLNAESDEVIEVEEVDNDSRLSGGAIAAIIVGSIFGAALVLLALYLMIVGTGSSSDSSYPHKAVEAGPPAEL